MYFSSKQDEKEYNIEHHGYWELLIKTLKINNKNAINPVDYLQSLKKRMNLWAKWIFYGNFIKDVQKYRRGKEKFRKMLENKCSIALLAISEDNSYSQKIKKLLSQ